MLVINQWSQIAAFPNNDSKKIFAFCGNDKQCTQKFGLLKKQNNLKKKKKKGKQISGTSLVVQMLRIHLTMQEAYVPSLVSQLRSHVIQSNQARAPQLLSPGTPEPMCASRESISSVQSLSHIWLFTTSWTAARQASLCITNPQSLPKFTSIESVMPSNLLILCRPLLLLPSIFPSIRVFTNESVKSGG